MTCLQISILSFHLAQELQIKLLKNQRILIRSVIPRPQKDRMIIVVNI